MILKGNDLIISSGDIALAAAKSCTIEVAGETIKVASPTSGDWEDSIPGRKSWNISTSHLLYSSDGFDGLVEAQAIANNNGVSYYGASSIKIGSATRQFEGRGLTLFEISQSQGVYSISQGTTFDTYADASTYEGICNQLITAIGAATSDMLALVSYDAFGLTSGLRTAIANNFKVDMSGVPTGRSRASMIVIGSKATGAAAGIMQYRPPVGLVGGNVHTKLYLKENAPVPYTTLKNFLLSVNGIYNLRVQVDGFGSDLLTGTAICKNAKTTGTLGNLMQGSFSFLGKGALS
jgi:hypothetical protein